MNAATTAGAGSSRQLSLIHILATQAGLIQPGDDSAYRDMLMQQTGQSSAKLLDMVQRAAVIRHLKAALPAERSYPQRPHNADVPRRRELKKIEALLTDAHKPWGYAEAILRHMTRGAKTRLEFADPCELAAVLTALEKQALKRLRESLTVRLAALGRDLIWAFAEAQQHCGLSENADLTRSTECMSLLLRRLDGAHG